MASNDKQDSKDTKKNIEKTEPELARFPSTNSPSASLLEAAANPKRRGRKPLDLSKAKVADGALKANQSVYAICGIAEHSYGSVSRAQYTQSLQDMNLIDLQEEAYTHGVVPIDNRELLIDRLERKFIQEVGKFQNAVGRAAVETQSGGTTEEQARRKKALEILARGR